MNVSSFGNLNRYQPAGSPLGRALCAFKFFKASYGRRKTLTVHSIDLSYSISLLRYKRRLLFSALFENLVVVSKGLRVKRKEAISSVEGLARRISFITSYIFSYNESQSEFDSNDLSAFFLTILLSCVRFLSRSYV